MKFTDKQRLDYLEANIDPAEGFSREALDANMTAAGYREATPFVPNEYDAKRTGPIPHDSTKVII